MAYKSFVTVSNLRLVLYFTIISRFKKCFPESRFQVPSVGRTDPFAYRSVVRARASAREELVGSTGKGQSGGSNISPKAVVLEW